MTTKTENHPGVALITRLVMDARVSGDQFMRDIIHHDFERRKWLEVKPFMDFGRSKDPIRAQQKAVRLVDTEFTVKYQLAYLCHHGLKLSVAPMERVNVTAALVRVMQHYRRPEDALAVLAYVCDESILEDAVTTLMAAPAGTMAPEVEKLMRNIAGAGMTYRAQGYMDRPVIPRISEEPWQKQPEPRPVAAPSGGARRNNAMAAAILAGAMSSAGRTKL